VDPADHQVIETRVGDGRVIGIGYGRRGARHDLGSYVGGSHGQSYGAAGDRKDRILWVHGAGVSWRPRRGPVDTRLWMGRKRRSLTVGGCSEYAVCTREDG